jgi:exopolyphosphatase/guanosine-5'-triphosphate,3'-diphosphate pyrophosphatase
LKFAAIDIGSNGVRLLIGRPLSMDQAFTPFKKVEFTRLPLRLGDDVFKTKEISPKKADLLLKSMKAFSLLLEVYNVDYYRACATSAMRDAKNGKKLIQLIAKETGIELETITGLEESKLIVTACAPLFTTHSDFIHIDVGGGSTEVSHIRNSITLQTMSFNIGTVRLRENKVKQKEWDRMQEWILQNFINIKKLKAIGTGGNISKLYNLSRVKEGSYLSLRKLALTTQALKKVSQSDRIYKLELNPDRAEVIDYAGEIYIQIMKWAGCTELIAPNVGLKDGMLHQMWLDFFQQSKTPSFKIPSK